MSAVDLLFNLMLGATRFFGVVSFTVGIVGMFASSLTGAMDQQYVTRAIDSALVMAYANAVAICILPRPKDSQ